MAMDEGEDFTGVDTREQFDITGSWSSLNQP